MSFMSDLKCLLCQKWIVEKLTLDERALLLYEITSDLDNDTYEKEDINGVYQGADLEKAKQHLKDIDILNKDLF